MSDPITINADCAVWLSEYHKPHELVKLLEQGNIQRIVNIVSLYGPPSMEKFSDYKRIGSASITLTLLPQDEQVRMAVQSLNDKLQELRAAYHSKQHEILAEISKLQALTYDEAEA